MRSHIQAEPSRRKVITLKGYQAVIGGQVLTALDAVKRCGQIFDGYQIIIHSAINTYASKHLHDVKQAVKDISEVCNVPIEFLPLSPPEAMWKLFGQARIAIAISNSDGTPNAMLEAMIMGAFPIQSDTGGLESWINSGVNGYLVPFDNVDAIAAAIKNALENDVLVDEAAVQNYRLTQERLDAETVRSQVIQLYKRVLTNSCRQTQ